MVFTGINIPMLRKKCWVCNYNIFLQESYKTNKGICSMLFYTNWLSKLISFQKIFVSGSLTSIGSRFYLLRNKIE